MRLLDLAGRRVAVADATGEAVMSTERLATGPYLVRCADGRTAKVVIN